MNATLEIVLRFVWDLVVLVATSALAWRGIIPAEMVTAVIGLYAGLYGGAMGMGPRKDGAGGPPVTMKSILPGAILVAVVLMAVMR